MGFFDFFKGKKKDVGEDSGANKPRPSRRVVTPGAKGDGAPQTGAIVRGAQPAKPGTQRVAAKPGSAPAPAAATAAKSGPAPAQKPAPATTMQSKSGPKPASAPAKPNGNDGMLIGSQPRPPSGPANAQRPPAKAPIMASKPLEFAGDLASGARGGPTRTGDQALLDFLINKARLLDAAQADQVREKAQADNVAIDVAAAQLAFLTEDKLVTALTQECWVPHLKVDKYEIRKKALDTISREDAEHYGVFPVDKLGSLLTLAMVNPLDTETIRVLESKTGLDIKKVVATRAEITQGIEKYYSGQVQAKEGSLGFVQDVEAKSVTQMIQNANVAAKPAASKPSAPLPAAKPPAKPSVSIGGDDIVPEIEDIDELLSSDEVIAPAIIEPVSIKMDEPATISMDELEPIPAASAPAAKKNSESERIGIDELDEIAISPAPAAKAPPAPSRPKPKDDGLIDLDIDLSMPEPAKPVAGTATIKTPMPASEAVPSTGALERLPKGAPAPVAPMAKSPAKAPVAPAPRAPVAPVAGAPVAPVAKAPAAPAKPAAPTTGRTAGAVPSSSKRYSRTASDVTNLIPVMEEEFQHAITHGRSQLFEKWVSLQSRNRIINAVHVEDEVAVILSSLFQNGRRL